MKCVDCGHEINEKKKENELKVTLNNPGVVFFKAKTIQCPNCKEHYIDEDDTKEAAHAFEENCKKMHKKQ